MSLLGSGRVIMAVSPHCAIINIKLPPKRALKTDIGALCSNGAVRIKICGVASKRKAF